MTKPQKPKAPPKKKEAEPEIEFGLSIDFNECVDEFYERAKVLPFVPKLKGE